MRQSGWSLAALALGFSLGAQEPAFRPQDDLRVSQWLDASPKQSSARVLRAF